MFTIYCHTHVVSQKRYVGQTKVGMLRRWDQHIRAACRGVAHPFYSAIRRHSVDAFHHDVLEEVTTQDAANEAEEWWIGHFNSADRAHGYNLRLGGQRASLSPETRKKMAEAARAREARMPAGARAAQARKRWASTPAKERSDMARRREMAKSAESRRASSRKAAATVARQIEAGARAPRPCRPKSSKKRLTRAERRELCIAREARKTPEQRREAVKKGHAKRTAESKARAAERLRASHQRASPA